MTSPGKPPQLGNAPLEFEPWLRPQVWGGRNLGELLGKTLPTTTLYGESWELCPLSPHVSQLSGDDSPAQTLNTIWNKLRQDLPVSLDAAPFPWLIKWLDCRDVLSVQVHPNAAQSLRWLGEVAPKSETWVVIAAEPSAVIYAGLQPGVTLKDIERRLGHPTLVDLLHAFHPQPGDCLYLPAGTIHSAGGGLVVAEVQQPSDATFRIHDWFRIDDQGQSRDLHWLEALDCLTLPQPPVLPVPPQPWPSLPAGAQAQQLLSVPEFQLDRLIIESECSLTHVGFSVWMVLEGSGQLTWSGGRKPIQRGMTLLFPPRLTDITWTSATPPQLMLLRITLPGWNSG